MRILSWTRRQFLTSLGIGAGAAAAAGLGGCAQELRRVGFQHGVASGDPLADRIILWTRVTRLDAAADAAADDSLEIAWEIAEDESFTRIAASGMTSTGPERDFTVKVDAQGLEAGQRYYYRFLRGPDVSPVGRTRTLGRGAIGAARLAVVSCSSFPHGFFNVYREIAGYPDIDLVVHLGDYIYEYDADTYASEAAKAKGRLVQPASELTALAHYRTRHALYKTDPDLQAVHARHPFVAVWDDHEIANDAWSGGAENHNEGEGDWAERRAAAIRAYREWMPIRDHSGDDPALIYRSFELGDVASLIMLDTRIIGRDRPMNFADDMVYRSLPFDFSRPDRPVAVTDKARLDRLPEDKVKHIVVPFETNGDKPKAITDYARIQALDMDNLPEGLTRIPDPDAFKSEKLNAAGREMLGAAQAAWLRDEMKRSSAAGKPWQIIGQQVIVGGRYMPDVKERIDPDRSARLSQKNLDFVDAMQGFEMPMNPDEWLGYGAARERFLADMYEHTTNCVVLSGDSHDSWAFDLFMEGSGTPAAVEFCTPGVTSPGLETIFPVEPGELGRAMQEKNPDMKYADVEHRGFMIVDVTAAEVVARWYTVDTILDREYTASMAKVLHSRAGELWLEERG